MRITIYILLVLTFFFQGCDDFQWNLERDNPLDSNADPGSKEEANIVFSKFEVYDDNNKDGEINKGESIQLKVYLKNSGGSRANAVKATITCSSNHISALTPTTPVSYSYSFYDYIDPGDEGVPSSSGSYLSFNVSSTTPEGTVISFNLEITDESNNTWTDNFTITVVATGAEIAFSRFEVYDDSNNDQQINPGESITLKVYLINNGSSRANSVKATISCSSSYISALTPSTPVSYQYSFYDYLDPGNEGVPNSSGSYLNFNVSSSIPEGTIITFDLEITDEFNNTWTDSFTITVFATGADIAFSRFEVYDDDNNDQQINPGESITLKVYLINNGSSRTNGVKATITCSSSYISGLTPTTAVSYQYSFYDYIEPGDEGVPSSSGSYLSFNVNSSTPVGTEIVFNIDIFDDFANTWNDTFKIIVQ